MAFLKRKNGPANDKYYRHIPFHEQHIEPQKQTVRLTAHSEETQNAAEPVLSGPSSYSHISASDNARQHNGNVYNYHSNTYTIRQRRSDETLRESTRNQELLKAAASGQTQRVESLIRLGADLDFYDDKGCTALHHAARSGFEDTVQALLAQGADVNAHSDVYGIPIYLAAAKGRGHVFKTLLQNRASTGGSAGGFGSLLHAAALGGELEVLKDLLEEFKCAVDLARNVERELIAELSPQLRELKGGSTYWPTGTVTPLHLAAFCGSHQVVSLLISRGCNVNAACNFTHQFRPPRNGATALLLTAYRGSPDVLRLLIEAGAVLDQEDQQGTTAMIYAAGAGILECLEILCSSGASATKRDHYGQTPLLFAARYGHAECLKYLISKGADVDTRTYLGNTALIDLIKEGRERLLEIQLLVDNKASLKALGADGKNALQIARENGQKAVVQILESARKFELSSSSAAPISESEVTFRAHSR